jgi:hypothetical protein
MRWEWMGGLRFLGLALGNAFLPLSFDDILERLFSETRKYLTIYLCNLYLYYS